MSGLHCMRNTDTERKSLILERNKILDHSCRRYLPWVKRNLIKIDLQLD